MKQRVLLCGALALACGAGFSVGQLAAPKSEGAGEGVVERSRISHTTHLDFMPAVDAPPPVTVVYPSGYTNNLELAGAAARMCSTLTNMAWLTHAERNALVLHWVEVFRTNGIPEKYRGGF